MTLLILLILGGVAFVGLLTVLIFGGGRIEAFLNRRRAATMCRHPSGNARVTPLRRP